ncbi:MAG: saccharopine dehydrogenase family protein [Bacteroidota bacterium]
MKNILLLGAGLSSSSIIRYLLDHSSELNLELVVVDQNEELILSKTKGHPRSKALTINALDEESRKPYIIAADLVISMLPARFHPEIAKDCIKYKKNLITPSYISDEIKSMNDEAIAAGIVIMNEIGVDPGIDHMSAMAVIHSIKAKGGKMHSFKSFCGGLVAPEFDNNPWHYKFTWNPRNVVLAGQGGASCFIEEEQYKYIPYRRLFKRLDHVSIEGFGEFEAYANRDSLKYRSIYGLDEIPTIYRGTFRRPGYSDAWSQMIDLGLTDDNYTMDQSEKLTPRQFLNAFLPYHPNRSVEDKLKDFLGDDKSNMFEKFEYLDFFADASPMALKNASPAQLLEEIMVRKLSLSKGDKDMLVMYHEFIYNLDDKKHRVTSHMVNIGEDQTYTSMSNTVGLPVAICAKMILTSVIKVKGVQMPILPEIYEPILAELDTLGISFIEKEEQL